MRFKKKQEKEPGVYRVSGVPSFFLQIFWVYLGFFCFFWRASPGHQDGGAGSAHKMAAAEASGAIFFFFFFSFFLLLLLLLLLLSSPLFRWKKPKEEEISRSLSLSLLIFFSFRFFFKLVAYP